MLLASAPDLWRVGRLEQTLCPDAYIIFVCKIPELLAAGLRVTTGTQHQICVQVLCVVIITAHHIRRERTREKEMMRTEIWATCLRYSLSDKIRWATIFQTSLSFKRSLINTAITSAWIYTRTHWHIHTSVGGTSMQLCMDVSHTPGCCLQEGSARNMGTRHYCSTRGLWRSNYGIDVGCINCFVFIGFG